MRDLLLKAVTHGQDRESTCDLSEGEGVTRTAQQVGGRPRLPDRGVSVFYDHETFSIQQYGGISRYFAELLQRVPACGVETRAFYGLTANRHLVPGCSGTGIRIPHFKGGRIARCFVNGIAQRAFPPLYGSAVIHKTYYGRQTVRKHQKLVITIHDMIQEHLPGHDTETSERKRYWCNRADAIIAISEATRRELIRIFRVPEGKTITIYHGAPSFPSAAPLNPEQRPIPEPYFLMVGGRDAYKNFRTLAAAFDQFHRRHPGVKLACFGANNWSPEERAFLEKHDLLRDVVHISGGDASLRCCYLHATAFVSPSIDEGFGLPLLESMAFSCPVLCSDIPAYREVAGDAAHYFDPRSVNDIADTLVRAVDSPTALRFVAARGNERVRMFDWQRCASETAALYKRLCA